MAADWQKLADTFQGVINEMIVVNNDPNSSGQEQAEARQIMVELQAYLRRLQIIHNIVPQVQK